MDRCRDEEPKVIDNAMLERCIEEQGPKGEAGRLAREEGIPMDEVEQIRLEFMRIIRIDHLWVLKSLTKLSLSNNLIEKIEDLDVLINLTELDLSFNKIFLIENLDTLVNLQILSLFENNITKIGNMDSLKKLMIFSIGCNSVEDRHNVLYLRKFKNLKSLNMAGNPCADDEDFTMFVSTFLPQIVYYEYKLVNDFDRESGLEIYSDLLRQISAIEEKSREIIEKQEAEIAEAELHSESFVEFLGTRHLFEFLFENDVEGNALLYMGDEAREFYNEYDTNFLIITKKIFEIGQEQYRIRKAEVDQFFKCVDAAKQTSQEESIEHMEKFIEQKAEIFYTVKKLQELVEIGDLDMEQYYEKMQAHADEYNDLIHKTWKLLMGLELTLYEQMEDVNQTFEHTITEMINILIEAAQGLFTEIRELEDTYTENITDLANGILTVYNAQPEDTFIADELVGILTDKEALNNALGATHDIHMQKIDDREDRLISRARSWLDNLVTGLQTDEIARDRAKVLEINHFLDIQREEFDELSMSINPGMDIDITAALS